MITVEMHQECMKAALEECMKECGVSRYEAASSRRLLAFAVPISE